MELDIIILLLVLAFELTLQKQFIPYVRPFKRNHLKNFLFWAAVRVLFYALLLLIKYLFF